MTPNQKRIDTLITNIAKDFSLDKLSKSPARFNLEKLNWFNREYIKMMSLEEFALRANLNKVETKYDFEKVRLADYVYLIDWDKQLIFVEREAGSENFPWPVGGGRDEGETSIEAVTREVSEETEGQLEIDPTKLTFITDFQTKTSHEGFDGTHCFVYCYSVNESQLKQVREYDNWKSNKRGVDVYNVYDWVNLTEFVEQNPYISYPIWKDFCERHNFLCFEPTPKIQQQYLAWLLDKNRVTTLNELGTESDCVLKWVAPSHEDLKWKKISLEESLANLKEISRFIETVSTLNEAQDHQAKLYNSIFTNQIEVNFHAFADFWETTLKNWLVENNKDVGSYLWPLRLALSGKTKSPSPFELLAILPPDQVQARISKCLG